MNNDELRRAAREAGFSETYFVAPPRYGERANNEGGIALNTSFEYPWATVAALLVWSYIPHPIGQRIPAYYINSNKAYHAAKDLAERLRLSGANVVRAELPIKPLVVDNGIGIICRSSLLAIGEYGTRMVFQALLVGDSENSHFETEAYTTDLHGCGACQICQDACPSHAIAEIRNNAAHACDRHGHTAAKCMRYYMDDSPYPDWVYAMQTTHIGCEICQQVCPRNRKLGFIAPDAELLSAFDLERLLSGDTAEARKLVGRNITGGDKLRIEAESFKRRGAR